MKDEAVEIEIARLRKRADRERRARDAAEAAAEQGTRLLYERHQQLQLLNAVADAANGATSVEAVIQVALDQICAYTGWPVGHAYLVTEDILVSTTLWRLARNKIGGLFRKAPIMSDKLQQRSGGEWNSTINGQDVANSNHTQRGVPTGGNFLYEDGHVEWRGFKYASLGVVAAASKIQLGTSGNWYQYLKPSDVDKGPW